MPTAVYLDRDDRIGSIRTKLEAAGDDEVHLVVPSGLEVLRDPVRVKVLRRHLNALGITATVFTSDGRIQDAARAEGLRTRDIHRLAKAASVPGARIPLARLKPPPRPGTRWPRPAWASPGIMGTGITLVFAAGAALVVLPRADIELRPPLHQVEQVLPITAATIPTREPLNVAARELQVEFEVATGEHERAVQWLDEAKAQGYVTFTLKGDQPVEVPAGTLVGVLGGAVYLTQDAVSVRPGSPPGVPVAVKAANPGTRPAAPLDITEVLDPRLAGGVEVTNPDPLQAGEPRPTAALNTDQYVELRQKAFETAQQEVLRTLQRVREPDTSFYPDTLRLRIMREEVLPLPPDEQGNTRYSLRLQGTGRVVAFVGSEVNRAIQDHFNKLDPDNEVAPGSLKTRVLENFYADNDTIKFNVRATAGLWPKLDEQRLKNALRGKNREEVSALAAQELGGGERPDVKLFPFWVSRVPDYLWQISLKRAVVQ